MGSERRRSARQKSFLRGRILFNNRRTSVDCLIRDISSLGARLIFSGAVNVPDVIELYIPQKEQTLRATVHWRYGEEVGVAFTQAGAAPLPSAFPETADLAQRVERLEAELVALKRVLKRLKQDAGLDTDAA